MDIIPALIPMFIANLAAANNSQRQYNQNLSNDTCDKVKKKNIERNKKDKYDSFSVKRKLNYKHCQRRRKRIAQKRIYRCKRRKHF